MTFIFLLAAVLAGCGSVVPKTLMELDRIDLMVANPADIMVAVALPQGVRVQPNGAKLTFTMTRFDTKETVKNVFVLAEAPARAADFGVAEDAFARFYAITSADVLRMQAMQAQARDWKQQSAGRLIPGQRGELRVDGYADFCATRSGPAPDAVTSFFVRVDPTAAFMPLVRNARLDRIGSDVIKNLPRCEGVQ